MFRGKWCIYIYIYEYIIYIYIYIFYIYIYNIYVLMAALSTLHYITLLYRNT